jgi:serine/threonine protein kinase
LLSGREQTQGIRFERYTIHRLLDVGGMAEVYRASVIGPGGFEKPVVIKRVKPEYAGNDVFVQMFIDEARISATLDHANIVRVYDFGQSGKHYYLALEFIDGVDLRALTEWLQARDQPRLGWQLATIVLREVLTGLEHAHQQLGPDGRPLGIVHRDIDLNNIMIRRDGAVKILDFGCAKAAKSIRRTETTVGIIKGKLGYMSPEQAWDEPLDRRSDVFSASVVFHELLTGQKLFGGEHPLEQLASVRKQPIPDPRRFDSKIPRALSRIVLRGLERDRDQRYASAGEMLGDLDGIVHKYRLTVAPLRDLLREVMADRDGAPTDADHDWQRTSQVWSGLDSAAPQPSKAASPGPAALPEPPPIAAPEELDAESGEITTKHVASSTREQTPSVRDEAPPVDEAAATVITDNPLWMLEEHVSTQETTAPVRAASREAPRIEQQFGPANLAALETKILPPEAPVTAPDPTPRPRARATAPAAPGGPVSAMLPADATPVTEPAPPDDAIGPPAAPEVPAPESPPTRLQTRRRTFKVLLAVAAVSAAVVLLLVLLRFFGVWRP